jgi:hypothetical protein
MSYSYIKSVFPNFKNSNNFGLGVDKEKHKSYNIEPAEVGTGSTEYKQVSDEVYEKKYSDRYEQNEISEKNNLHFYKPRLPDMIETPQQKRVNTVNTKRETKVVENFRNPISSIVEYLSPNDKPVMDNNNSETDISNLSIEHTGHINHVLSCNRCMDIIEKQLNIKHKQNIKEEFFEMISYILFGIFILLLLENRRQ